MKNGFLVAAVYSKSAAVDPRATLSSDSALISTATLDSSMPEPPSIGFSVNEKGVWFQANQEGEPQWLSSPIYVEALTRDASSQSWGRLLRFKDQDKVAKSWAMPMELLASDGAEIRRNLLSLGVEMAIGKKERQLLLAYLQSSRPMKRAQCVNRIGWHQGSYVMPHKIYHPALTTAQIILQTLSQETAFQRCGALIDWQTNIGSYCAGNSRLVFAVSIALASTLLKETGEESGGFHFVGPSSCGKSITLKIAASVWGNPGLNGFVKRWRSTLNGLELLAASRCDSLLVLDELGEVLPKDAGNAAYMLSGGTSKTRATKYTSLAAQLEWRLLFLSSGEITLADHVAQSGVQVNVGQEVRMIDIPAETNGSFGIFENIHHFSSSGSFASWLSENVEKNFGSPIDDFLFKIVTKSTHLESLSRKRTEFINIIPKNNYHGQVLRALKRFSLVAAAGELAIELGTLPWEKGEANRAAKKCFEDWLENWGGSDSRELSQLIAQIKNLLQEFGASRFPTLSEYKFHPDGHHQQLWGFKVKISDDEYEWLILSEIFRSHFCKGHEYKRAVRDLKDKGILTASTTPMRLPHLGVTRAMRIKGRILTAL